MTQDPFYEPQASAPEPVNYPPTNYPPIQLTSTPNNYAPVADSGGGGGNNRTLIIIAIVIGVLIILCCCCLMAAWFLGDPIMEALNASMMSLMQVL